MKVHAVLLSLSGISMNRSSFLLRVSAQSVLHWIRAVATEHDQKPEPAGKTIILQLDELGHYLKQKRRKLWIWKALNQSARDSYTHAATLTRSATAIRSTAAVTSGAS